MLVVVQMHGLLIDVRLQGAVVVGERGNFVGHRLLLLSLAFQFKSLLSLRG
jgi:hypothetical protein